MARQQMLTGTGLLSDMVTIVPSKTARISSWDRTGGNRDALRFRPGEKKIIAELDGPGAIRHVYITTIERDPLQYRKVVIRIFWDGEETPSVEVPFGDLFGAGFCLPQPFQSFLVAVNPGGIDSNSYGFNLYFPMPFAKSARVEVENQSEARSGGFWYHVDYEELRELPQNVGRFHAQWRRENPCKAVPRETSNAVNLSGDENYLIFEAKGQGNYVGFLLNVDNLCGAWYGEGDDMIFIDGEGFPPSYHGTGTEEIFGGGAGPNCAYFGPYTGFHFVSHRDWTGKQSMYRFHVHDPVRFQKSIRVTLEHGHANDLGNDYSSTAFWYQLEPHAPFPKLPPVEERLPRFPEDFWPGYRYWMEALKVIGQLDWRERPDAEELRPLLSLRNTRRVLKAFVEERWDEWQAGTAAVYAALRRRLSIT